MTKWRFITVSD